MVDGSNVEAHNDVSALFFTAAAFFGVRVAW